MNIPIDVLGRELEVGDFVMVTDGKISLTFGVISRFTPKMAEVKHLPPPESTNLDRGHLLRPMMRSTGLLGAVMLAYKKVDAPVKTRTESHEIYDIY